MKDPIVVCVTGAAGQIAYSLLPIIVRGGVFGHNQPIQLRLLDIEPALGALDGVVMELEDLAEDLLIDVVPTADPTVAFEDADAVFLLGAFPRKQGMQRKDLLAKNVGIFKEQGAVLDKVAKKSVKVVVVGNPANTNALIASWSAPSIPATQFTALTQLDATRARSMIAKKVGVRPSQVKNVVVWGNHSATQCPDIEHAYIDHAGKQTPVKEAVKDAKWLSDVFAECVATRGGAVIKARKLSSACSAAKAVADHMHTWWHGTEEGEYATMAVITQGAYDLEKGLIFSMPVTIHNGEITVVDDLPISEALRSRLQTTQSELVDERESARSILQ